MITFESEIFGPVILRPTPFVSISSSPIRNKVGHFGSDYTITLTGTLLPNKGSPFVVNASGTKFEFNEPYSDTESSISSDERANAIIVKQNAIRELFAYDGMVMRIDNGYDGTNSSIVTNVTAESINFEEGSYISRCGYTITLKATYLKDNLGNLYHDSMINIYENTGGPSGVFRDETKANINYVFSQHGGFVEDFTDEWSIESDDSLGETSDTDPLKLTPKTYIITRNTSAIGRTIYYGKQKYEAWENAKNFLVKSLPGIVGNSVLSPSTGVSAGSATSGNSTSGIPPLQYPDYANTGSDEEGGTANFGDIVLNLSKDYGGYNHSRTENINKNDGTVSITDRWVLLQTGAYENYDVSIESNNNDPFTTFNINGSIKGVTGLSAQSTFYGGTSIETNPTPAENAIAKYKIVSNNGLFDINSFIYKRVSAITNLAVNPQPLSISISRNDFTGEITYAVSYNNRPLNIISEALNEDISIQDTYPGDLYSIIPVIGRPTGPVLQYIGGRTEYRRSISINLQFDYTDIDRYTPAKLTADNKADELINTRSSLLMSKPTLIEPIRSQINNLVRSLSPLNEPNIRKCFVDAPNESWEPRTGRYSLSISWVYELGNSWLNIED